MTRSLVREYIFKLLFRVEFNAADELDDQVRLFFEDSVEDEEIPVVGADIPEADAEYIKSKFEKIVALLPEIDAKISETSKGWKIERIGKIEIAVLRLAVYEMLYDDDIPVGVAIDEAVELVKKYGPDSSPAFVNGILASIAK